MTQPKMNCDNPIFIVGAPRSGTTLLRSILDANPNICCPTWETGAFEKFAMIVDGDVNIHFASDPAMPIARPDLLAWCRRSFDDLMGQLTKQADKPRWAEKTPAHVFHINLIHDVYPEAQFIHILRNGREVVRSLQSMPWAPRKIRWSSRRWVDSVIAGRTAGKALPEGLYKEIRYEELTANAEGTIRELCDFLNDPFTQQMLEFHKPDNNSWGVTSKPINTKPVNQHRDLSVFERLVFSRVGASLLRELGYR